MACRTLLVKLHERELITLPPRRQTPTRRMAKRGVPDIAHDTAPIENSLADLRPLRIIAIQAQSVAEPLYRCLLSRYHYLGYTSTVGENMKYLILPWVKVPHLASHILSLLDRCISQDWTDSYGHGVCMLETFVDTTRFSGTCYRAANWQPVPGSTANSRGLTWEMGDRISDLS